MYRSMCATSLCHVCLSVHLQLVKFCKSIHIRLYTDKDSNLVTKSFRYYTRFLFDDVYLITSKVRGLMRQR